MRTILPYLLCLLLLACEKDIHIDYHEASPILVIEGAVTESGMEARLSLTQAMDDNSTDSDISGAEVTVSGSDGSTTALRYTENGHYKADAPGTPGVEYRMDVRLDGRHYTSTSVMQKKPTLIGFRLLWKKILSERFLMGRLTFQDLPNESNWYFLHIYRNGTGYRWAVKRDDTDPNRELQQLFSFDREGSTDKDMLQEGDKLHIELRAIDQRAYDYLYSMQLMDNTNTNPIPNFTGGCLGYFSAYGQASYDYTVHIQGIEEEE